MPKVSSFFMMLRLSEAPKSTYSTGTEISTAITGDAHGNPFKILNFLLRVGLLDDRQNIYANLIEKTYNTQLTLEEFNRELRKFKKPSSHKISTQSSNTDSDRIAIPSTALFLGDTLADRFPLGDQFMIDFFDWLDESRIPFLETHSNHNAFFWELWRSISCGNIPEYQKIRREYQGNILMYNQHKSAFAFFDFYLALPHSEQEKYIKKIQNYKNHCILFDFQKAPDKCIFYSHSALSSRGLIQALSTLLQIKYYEATEIAKIAQIQQAREIAQKSKFFLEGLFKLEKPSDIIKLFEWANQTYQEDLRNNFHNYTQQWENLADKNNNADPYACFAWARNSSKAPQGAEKPDAENCTVSETNKTKMREPRWDIKNIVAYIHKGHHGHDGTCTDTGLSLNSTLGNPAFDQNSVHAEMHLLATEMHYSAYLPVSRVYTLVDFEDWYASHRVARQVHQHIQNFGKLLKEYQDKHKTTLSLPILLVSHQHAAARVSGKARALQEILVTIKKLEPVLASYQKANHLAMKPLHYQSIALLLKEITQIQALATEAPQNTHWAALKATNKTEASSETYTQAISLLDEIIVSLQTIGRSTVCNPPKPTTVCNPTEPTNSSASSTQQKPA